MKRMPVVFIGHEVRYLVRELRDVIGQFVAMVVIRTPEASVVIRALILIAAMASIGHSQEGTKPAEAAARHEKMEDKARTVKGGASKGVKACHADIERWCKTVKPGDGRLGACLKKRSKKLSAVCLRWAAHGGEGAIEEALARDIDGPSK